MLSLIPGSENTGTLGFLGRQILMLWVGGLPNLPGNEIQYLTYCTFKNHIGRVYLVFQCKHTPTALLSLLHTGPHFFQEGCSEQQCPNKRYLHHTLMKPWRVMMLVHENRLSADPSNSLCCYMFFTQCILSRGIRDFFPWHYSLLYFVRWFITALEKRSQKNQLSSL